MKCDICKKNDASIHIQEMMNGHNKSINLCAQCASEKKMADSDIEGFNLSEILYNLSTHMLNSLEPEEGDLGQLNSEEGKAFTPNVVCMKCNWDSTKFRKTGRLGCGHCYTVFSKILKNALSNMHKGTIHFGKHPAKIDPSVSDIDMKIVYCQNKLDEYVKKEEYEKAAKVRDEIINLKNSIKSK